MVQPFVSLIQGGAKKGYVILSEAKNLPLT